MLMFWCYLVMIFRLLNYWRLIDWWMILNLLHCSLLLILHYSLLTFTKHIVFLSFLFLFFKTLLSCGQGRIFFNVKNIFFFHHLFVIFSPDYFLADVILFSLFFACFNKNNIIMLSSSYSLLHMLTSFLCVQWTQLLDPLKRSNNFDSRK